MLDSMTSLLTHTVAHSKGGFFSESVIRFLISKSKKKNIPKNYPELEIQNSRP